MKNRTNTHHITEIKLQFSLQFCHEHLRLGSFVSWKVKKDKTFYTRENELETQHPVQG